MPLSAIPWQTEYVSEGNFEVEELPWLLTRHLGLFTVQVSRRILNQDVWGSSLVCLVSLVYFVYLVRNQTTPDVSCRKFHASRFTSSHCQLAAKTVCTSWGC